MRFLKSNSNIYIDDERLYNLYLKMNKTDFVEYLNKEIFIIFKEKSENQKTWMLGTVIICGMSPIKDL